MIKQTQITAPIYLLSRFAPCPTAQNNYANDVGSLVKLARKMFFLHDTDPVQVDLARGRVSYEDYNGDTHTLFIRTLGRVE